MYRMLVFSLNRLYREVAEHLVSWHAKTKAGVIHAKYSSSSALLNDEVKFRMLYPPRL